MCDQHSNVAVRVYIPAHLSYSGEARWDVKGIDSCIASIVEALNEAGLFTVTSCCGHNKNPGSIWLLDGRELIIAPDRESARVIGRAFS